MGNVYYMDKETFVLKSKQQILVYNYMIEDLKNILPIVQKFDQKFLTKRLTTAMEKVLKTFNRLLITLKNRLTNTNYVSLTMMNLLINV